MRGGEGGGLRRKKYKYRDSVQWRPEIAGGSLTNLRIPILKRKKEKEKEADAGPCVQVVRGAASRRSKSEKQGLEGASKAILSFRMLGE